MKLVFLFDVKLKKYKNDYYSINLNKELWQKKYYPYFDEIVVISRYVDANSEEIKTLHVTNVEHVKVVAHKTNGAINRVLNTRNISNSICDVIRTCDVAICRNSFGVKECKKVGIPYMIEVISCPWDSMWNHSYIGKIAAPFFYYSLKKATANSKYVMYVTEKFLQKRYPTKGKTVGVSDVIITPMTDLEKEQRIDKIRNYKKQKPIKIGTTAAVNVSYKGQRFVIEALGMLKKKGITNFEYHLAGSGDQSALKSVAESCNVSDKVIFHGNVKHEELNSFLDSLDVYIQPSLQEGLPRALVEAMSRGLLCIGADTGGIPELLEDKWICHDKKRLSVEIAEKLKYTLNSDKLEDSVIFNINRSNDFREEKLTQKRDSFMQEFISYAKKINRRR